MESIRQERRTTTHYLLCSKILGREFDQDAEQIPEP